jgi:hypothetical protein
MKMKKKSRNHGLGNQHGEHIVGYLIHLNENKTK